VHGYVSGDTVYLNRNSDKSILVTMVHELTHKTENTKFYKEIHTAAINWMHQTGVDMSAFRDSIAEIYAENGIELSDSGIDYEITAKFIADVVFGTEAEVFNFVHRNQSLAQKIKGWIDTLLGRNPEDVNLKIAKRNFEKALMEVRRQGKTIDGVGRYDVGKSLKEQLAAYKNSEMQRDQVFYIGRTPNVMQAIGANVNDIIMTQRTLQKITREATLSKTGHKLTYDMIERALLQISNPVMILESDTVSNSIVIVTEVRDSQGRSIIVPIYLNTTQDYKIVDKVTSIYGKDNELDFFTEQIMRGNLLYYNNKKAARLLRSGGLQLPRREANADFDYKLPQDGVFVKKIGEKAQYDIGRSFTELVKQERLTAKDMRLLSQKDSAQTKTPNPKQSNFAKNMAGQKIISETGTYEALSSKELVFYDGITNKETLKDAQQRLREGGEAEALRWWQTEDAAASHDSVVEGILLMEHYDKMGDYEGVVAIAE
jgi:hypothetical protein